MTLRNRGAKVLLASLFITTLAGVGLSAGRAFAADPLVPEMQDVPATPPPPTAALPGTDPLGSVATPTPSAPPAVVTAPPAAPSPVPIPTASASPTDEPLPAEVQAPEPSPSSPPNNVVVDVKQDEPDWPNIDRKKYLEYHSHWGVELDVAPAALGRNLSLGGKDSNGNAVNNQPWGIGLGIEYQPEWFQKLGILSFGPTVNLYPSFSSNDDFPNAEAIWSIGAQIRYQFRFKEQQFIVPMLAYSYEKLSYHLVTEGTGSLGISGPTVGVNVLLNDLDPLNSTAFYFDAGVLKTYLVIEGRFLEGDDGVMDVSGLSWFFGVRMEF
jgi:hypothetical protein